MECMGCFGPLTLLGQLGSMAHYRCRDCGLDHSGPAPAEEEKKMCGPNIKLVDLIYEAMREEPGFDLISADRQGEMAMEVEAILLAAMEDGDLQIVDEEDIRQAEGWAGKKAREYVRNELEGWK